jgi:hypothetical protein
MKRADHNRKQSLSRGVKILAEGKIRQFTKQEVGTGALLMSAVPPVITQ